MGRRIHDETRLGLKVLSLEAVIWTEDNLAFLLNKFSTFFTFGNSNCNISYSDTDVLKIYPSLSKQAVLSL